jgi:hypothetical protein
MNERLQRDLQNALEWMERNNTREDDEVKIHLSRLMNWIHVLQLQQTLQSERQLWEL